MTEKSRSNQNSILNIVSPMVNLQGKYGVDKPSQLNTIEIYLQGRNILADHGYHHPTPTIQIFKGLKTNMIRISKHNQK
jgi:hypothetical protein